MIVLAHPLTQRAELPLSALELALLAAYILLMASAVAGWRSRARTPAPAGDAAPQGHDDDPVPGAGPGRFAFWAVRAVGVALLLLVIGAGWLGDQNQVRNIAPALTLGAGWPLMTLAAMGLGGGWWWLNPYDTAARGVAGLGAGSGSGVAQDGSWAPVWWAIAPGALWMMYLTVWPSALVPGTIAVAAIAYLMVTLAGSLALGRKTWLWRAEFFTVFFGLLAAGRRPDRWVPPAGAAALLGVVCGGALFGLVRDSDLGLAVAYGPNAILYSRIAIIASMLVAGVAAHWCARRVPAGTVAVCLAPMAAALVLALAVERNRFTTSLQLLPIAASNPLGGDYDLFGTRLGSLHPQPLGQVGPVWVQAAVLLIGALAGMLLARRFVARRAGSARSAAAAQRRSAGVVFGLLGTLLAVGVAAAAAI